MKKFDPSKIVSALKAGIKESKKPFNPAIKPEYRVRDMRQESMDMGSHGAKEFFGEAKQNE